ncbi:MAG: hypothetical protein K2W95_33030 [Candidatus Obscuribacterales bacterium]|nr:hypothetical protein [Candidatus Obscuribacterales bacterium]
MPRSSVFFVTTILLLFSAFISSRTNAAETDPLAIYRDCGASAEQELKIRQLASDYEKSARVRLQRIKNLQQQLKEQSFCAELDEKKVFGLQEEINSLQTGLSMDRLKLMLSIRQSLNTEQKEKLVQLMKEKSEAGADLNAQ